MNNNISKFNKQNKQQDPELVQAVDRAITLLQLVAESNGPILASDLAIKANMNRTTVWRLLVTLENRNFVERDPITKGYQLGYAATRLVRGNSAHDPLIRRAYKYLERLGEETGETVLLSVPKHFSTLTIYQIDPPHSVRLVDYVNTNLPLHCTSNGKLLLSRLNNKELNFILEQPMKKYTSQTITDPDKLREEISFARKRGYATVLGELSENENGISAPIITKDGELVAFVSVSGPDFRFTSEKMIELAPDLISTAQEIAKSLEL